MIKNAILLSLSLILISPQFSHAKRSTSSKVVEDLETHYKESQKHLKTINGHLTSIKSQVDKWLQRAYDAESYHEWYKTLPKDLKVLSETQLNEFYATLRKHRFALEEATDALGAKIKVLTEMTKKSTGIAAFLADVRKWDPENAAEDPTYGLKLIEDIIRTGAKIIPKPVKTYVLYLADATKAFRGATLRLNDALDNARQGSVCGQRWSRSRNSISKYIQEKTSYECSTCKVQGSWSTFEGFLAVQCTEGGEKDGGWIFYNGDKGRGYDVPGETSPQVVHGWMASGKVPKSRRTFKWLKSYSNALDRDRAGIETVRKKIIDRSLDIEAFAKCDGRSADIEINRLAHAGVEPFLEFAIINRSKYTAQKGLILDKAIDRQFLFQGKVTVAGKKKKLSGIKVRILNGEKGPSVATKSVSSGKSYCIKVDRSKLPGKVYVSASHGKLSNASQLYIDAGKSRQFAGILLGGKSGLLDEIASLEDSCAGLPCDLCFSKDKTGCIDCRDKGCDVCPGSKVCLKCKGLPCGDCKAKVQTGCVKGVPPTGGEDPEPDKDKDKGKGESPDDRFASDCESGIGEARNTAQTFKARARDFKNAFETGNGKASCSDQRAAYYYVEMGRLSTQFYSEMDGLKSLFVKAGKELGGFGDRLDACFVRYQNAQKSRARMGQILAGANRRYNSNNCDLQDVVNDGQLFPPGMSSSEVETTVSAISGLWQNSLGGAPSCIDFDTLAGSSSSGFAAGGFNFTTTVIASGNRIEVRSNGTGSVGVCSVVTSIQFIYVFGPSTATANGSTTTTTTGDTNSGCGVSATVPVSFTLTKVGESCSN